MGAWARFHLLQCSVLTPVQEAGLKGDGRAPSWGCLACVGTDIVWTCRGQCVPSLFSCSAECGTHQVLLRSGRGDCSSSFPSCRAPYGSSLFLLHAQRLLSTGPLNGVCSHSIRTALTQRGRTNGRRGARRDCRGYEPCLGLRDALFRGAGS